MISYCSPDRLAVAGKIYADVEPYGSTHDITQRVGL